MLERDWKLALLTPRGTERTERTERNSEAGYPGDETVENRNMETDTTHQLTCDPSTRDEALLLPDGPPEGDDVADDDVDPRVGDSVVSKPGPTEDSLLEALRLRERLAEKRRRLAAEGAP